jgi:hypothetical protein
MHLAYSQPRLIHQRVDGIIADAQQRIPADGCKQPAHLVDGQGVGTIAVSLPDFKHIVKWEGVGLGHIRQCQKVRIASQREDLTIDCVFRSN